MQTGKFFKQIFLFCFLILFFGCARRMDLYDKPYNVYGRTYYPIRKSEGFTQIGIASWYGKDFHGKKTSSGEIYDMNLKTAAHTILPLGTYVKVTNLENDKTTVVKINDRGPFVRGRIIDLSYAVACELDMYISGTAKIKIEALDKNDAASISSKDFTSGNFAIQIGSFKNKENADKLVEKLKRMYGSTRMAIINAGDEKFYRIRVGKYNNLDQAHLGKKELEDRGYLDAMVVMDE